MNVKRKPRAAQLGVTDEDYARMLATQDGGCGICGKPPKTEHANKPWTCRYCKAPNSAGYTLCGGCGRARPKPRGLDVDHDHKTGKVRGLLCHRCNRGLTWFGDSPLKLSRAARYVENSKPPSDMTHTGL
jgi:hypothetical protein